MKLFGPGPAIDAAAALAVVYAVAGRAALASAVEGLSRVSPTEGRLCPRAGRDQMLILDDSYNANPASAAASIQAAAEIAWARDARFVAVLGDMLELGAESREAHEEVGRAVVRAGAGALFTCGMEMRAASQAAWETAHAEEIPAPELAHVLDAADLLPRVQKRLRPKDVVLVKGSRGMGMERVVASLVSADAKGAP
jgi:UDP-N-acetylmuramoyl-tripeptide--D-alanyl-D-alanine ligase